MAQISSIGTQSPMSIHPTAPLRAAIDIMAKRGFRRIPIVHDYYLVGILTASDVLRAMYKGDTENLNKEVKHFMTEEPIAVYSDIPISDAIQMMYQNNVSCLPTASPRDEILDGIVTERDLLRAFVNSIADADLEGFINENPLKMTVGKKKLGKVMEEMIDKGTSRVIFVNNKKKVEGILTVKDIIKFMHNKLITLGDEGSTVLEEPVSNLIVKDIQTMNINMSVAEVARIMVEKKIGGVPIVDDNDEFVGLFSEREVLALIGTYGLI
ncbi:MAG: CBS domain-containing protein [Candidatus Heimdallarchaeota archaeon]|nr:CBS domain-containing protein [Candidatus Heimdallarchaeota archaeon]